MIIPFSKLTLEGNLNFLKSIANNLQCEMLVTFPLMKGMRHTDIAVLLPTLLWKIGPEGIATG